MDGSIGCCHVRISLFRAHGGSDDVLTYCRTEILESCEVVVFVHSCRRKSAKRSSNIFARDVVKNLDYDFGEPMVVKAAPSTGWTDS